MEDRAAGIGPIANPVIFMTLLPLFLSFDGVETA
jgi:hypothetical protein